MSEATATANLATGITYTFPQDIKLPAELRGITATGGRPKKHAINGKATQVVEFETKINGKTLVMIVAGKPALECALVDYFNAEIKTEAEKKTALELSVPGITEIMDLYSKVSDDNHRYNLQFNRMMEDEHNDGVNPPEKTDSSKSEKLNDLLQKCPRAALYLKAKLQSDNCHWSDNSGKGIAGDKAMAILASGGSIQDAEIAISVRREFND